ncbi:MAG: aminotransferase class V-fold PLP-dependent enzyme, partial [Candidatus Bathyarchaeota archaeon]
MSIYTQLGVRRVVNGRGHLTLLGGSILPKEVIDAMIDANQCFVNLDELQEKSGELVAKLLGAESALVTSGAFAALVLASAACMTGDDKELIEKLPHTESMRNEIIIQKGLRTNYDRAMTVPGAKLLEVGDEKGTLLQHIEEAINDRTAAIHFLAPGGHEGTLSFEKILRLGKDQKVPVIVDAAGQALPPENLKKYVAMKADLVCYGAKYFDGPNSAGILCGNKALVEAAKLQMFVRFESQGIRNIGRGMKLDRQEIVATVVALQRWLTMDHKVRLQAQNKKILWLVNELNKLKGVTAKLGEERMEIPTSACVTLKQEKLGLKAKEVVELLKNGDPCVWTNLRGETIVIS